MKDNSPPISKSLKKSLKDSVDVVMQPDTDGDRMPVLSHQQHLYQNINYNNKKYNFYRQSWFFLNLIVTGKAGNWQIVKLQVFQLQYEIKSKISFPTNVNDQSLK